MSTNMKVDFSCMQSLFASIYVSYLHLSVHRYVAYVNPVYVSANYQERAQRETQA